MFLRVAAKWEWRCDEHEWVDERGQADECGRVDKHQVWRGAGGMGGVNTSVNSVDGYDAADVVGGEDVMVR